jgi:hypothetical protein
MKPAAALLCCLALLVSPGALRAAEKEAPAAPSAAKPAAKPAAQAAAKPAKAAAAPKKPAGPCYSKAEFAAEQGIRFHTELMVIGLSCQAAAAPGQDLFADYKRVTLALRDPIVAWERALIAHYKRSGAANPTRALDNFRTAAANENARRIAAVTTPVYCQTHIPMLQRALTLSAADARREVDEPRVVHIGAAQRCDMPAAP